MQTARKASGCSCPADRTEARAQTRRARRRVHRQETLAHVLRGRAAARIAIVPRDYEQRDDASERIQRDVALFIPPCSFTWPSRCRKAEAMPIAASTGLGSHASARLVTLVNGAPTAIRPAGRPLGRSPDSFRPRVAPLTARRRPETARRSAVHCALVEGCRSA